MHSKGKVSMYKPGGRPAENGALSAVQVDTDKKEKNDDEDEFVQTKSNKSK